LAAAWSLVWRKDDDRVRRSGLALGGLVIPGRLDIARVLGAARDAALWALLLTAIIAVPYFCGWRLWWQPRLSFSLAMRPLDAADELLGQVLVIALPEEAFYRGYCSRDSMRFGAEMGRARGARRAGPCRDSRHFCARAPRDRAGPARLAVFFPALVFGWLRARTGGIGASVCFHASCNVYSLLLGRGYGAY